ncbi:hypothetical protein NQD34_008950 [Periophthalmus magnuspinnatus]|nr:hypothetical protein NQD34_008950 [Periophthalmus magnuspinnatus]
MQMRCTIYCTPGGCLVDVPEEVQHELSLTAEMKTSTIYWVGNLSPEMLVPAKLWEKFISANLSNVRTPEYQPHCTLKYLYKSRKKSPQNIFFGHPTCLQINYFIGKCVISQNNNKPVSSGYIPTLISPIITHKVRVFVR